MVAEVLSELLSAGLENTLLISLGNSLRSDDGVGPYLAGQLANIPGVQIENAGDCPERAIDFVPARQPQQVVFIDAADFGAHPGSVRVIKSVELSNRSLSSHRLPLPALIDWIEAEHSVSCHCLGIQAGSMQIGEGLTPEVAETAGLLIDWFEQAAQKGEQQPC